MADQEQRIIEIPEITRVEGHSAVVVNLQGGKVESVQLDVFEGTRFFEKIVVGHKYYEIPHITSRVCAICSAGHVLAAIFAIEPLINFQPNRLITLLRELMHLGMIIESHSTHIFALALPDFIGCPDLVQFATLHPQRFKDWSTLRNLGSAIQTCIGGRPFHPVNLQTGGFSRYPTAEELNALLPALAAGKPLAIGIAEFLLGIKPEFRRTSDPMFMALIQNASEYGYFGTHVRSSDGWEASIADYKVYLDEKVVAYSHAKRSTSRGKPLMVGSMARLRLFADRLHSEEAKHLYSESALSNGDSNTVWNNLAQAIEVVEAIDRCVVIINEITATLLAVNDHHAKPDVRLHPTGTTVGAIECPRGTLYHAYTFDETGTILAADLVTPSAQNTGRIEIDIREVVEAATDPADPRLQSHLERLVRAYDPCNTCATHMVQLNRLQGTP